MAEYIEREALCAKCGAKEVDWCSDECVVLNAPAADVAPVVRCKDCKHQIKVWHPDKRMKDGGYWVYGCKENSDPFVSHVVNGQDNEFCSYGERKESNAGLD